MCSHAHTHVFPHKHTQFISQNSKREREITHLAKWGSGSRKKKRLPSSNNFPLLSTPLEKIGLALVTAAKKPPQYFQAHTIYVVTQYPVQAMFQRADFTGWISKWGAKIGTLDVKYLPRTAIKG